MKILTLLSIAHSYLQASFVHPRCRNKTRHSQNAHSKNSSAGGRFELAEQLYAKDFANHGIHRDISLEEDQAALKGWHQAFPDVAIEPKKLIAEGDLVVVYWIARGTNTGTGNGLPATGKKVEQSGITIWRIVDGKIKEEWSAFDQLSMMKQLGLLPNQKTSGAGDTDATDKKKE